MSMRVAIHHRKGSFSDRWIEYCTERRIPYTVVNCYDWRVTRELGSADVLLWHFVQTLPKDLLMARSVIRAAELMGLHVFPNTPTCWHFDDKIAQKYLLEAVGAPLVPTYVFLELDDALDWIERAVFPKVFKLSRGAGSQNVRLVRGATEARSLARRAFGSGFKPVGRYLDDARTKFGKARRRGDLRGVLSRLPRALRNIQRTNRLLGRERGYVYFQDFLAGNDYDTRVAVIGSRAFGFTRGVRANDFRASGSGQIDHDVHRVDRRCVSIALDVAGKIGAQSLAFDFVRDPEGEQRIVEISYCYLADVVYDCPGHWDRDLAWHEGHVWPQDAILEDILQGAVGRRT